MYLIKYSKSERCEKEQRQQSINVSIGFDYFTSYTVILDPTRGSGTFFRVTTHIQSIYEIFIQINHIKSIFLGIKNDNFLNSTFI